MRDDHTIIEATAAIVAAFDRYNHEFRQVTVRAKQRFETREWLQGQRDAVERIELYETSVAAAVVALRDILGDQLESTSRWQAIRDEFAKSIEDLPDSEFYKTFFSSLTRRVLKTVGVNSQAEFAALEVKPTRHSLETVQLRRYSVRGPLHYLIDELLNDYAFATPYRNRERTVRYLSAEVKGYYDTEAPPAPLESVELLEPVFYRGPRAYLVGRLSAGSWASPFVIALKCTGEGIYADAIIVSTSDVSMLFGFTRSYFHVDLAEVGPVVSFLKTVMPTKPIAEIYTILGRAKQGKTERYRHFYHHLENSTDVFEHADGDKGMVMEVFTLPSYNVVFKLIRDKFAYPKSMSRRDVIEKYQLVFKHDRAGRLVDAQEFRRLEFNRKRFSTELLDNLTSGCANICHLDGEKLVIDHLYIERRLTPLNLFLINATEQQAARATIDYGQALRDLANSNIFAGDLLLKNFGVTRHGRVIFYDYDELCLVTECNFRHLPPADNTMDEMRAGAWFYVGPNDIFPEQFVQFLGLSPTLEAVFMEHHAELLDADYWNSIKTDHDAGRIHEVVPYASKSWANAVRDGLYLSKSN